MKFLRKPRVVRSPNYQATKEKLSTVPGFIFALIVSNFRVFFFNPKVSKAVFINSMQSLEQYRTNGGRQVVKVSVSVYSIIRLNRHLTGFRKK